MARLRRVTLEFEDGETEVMEGPEAESWRRNIERSMTIVTLRDLDSRAGSDPVVVEDNGEEVPSVALWEFLEDLGERGIAILLYLYRSGGLHGITTDDVAEDMGLPVDDVEECLGKLRDWGFLEEFSEE